MEVKAISKCDICGEEKLTLYKCDRCGSSFCVKCGDHEIPLCTKCSEK